MVAGWEDKSQERFPRRPAQEQRQGQAYWDRLLIGPGENRERAVLRQLLGELDLEGVLIQADALHTQQPFFGNSRSRGPTSC